MTVSEITQLENDLYKAIRESDIEKLDELLHKDLLFVIPSGEVISKEDDLQTYREGKLRIKDIIPNIENVKIIDGMAVVIVTMILKGNYEGSNFESKYRYIRFWKEFPDGFKVIGGSGTLINS